MVIIVRPREPHQEPDRDTRIARILEAASLRRVQDHIRRVEQEHPVERAFRRGFFRKAP